MFSLVDHYFCIILFFFFFFNDTATTEIYTLSLHDALPISRVPRHRAAGPGRAWPGSAPPGGRSEEHTSELQSPMYLVCRLLLEKKKALAVEAKLIISNNTVKEVDVSIRTQILISLRNLYDRLVFAFIFVSNDLFFFFNDTATTEIYTLSLHDALPI